LILSKFLWHCGVEEKSEDDVSRAIDDPFFIDDVPLEQSVDERPHPVSVVQQQVQIVKK
jgi:hypothetical protein